ncbi:uncharacterized protein TrAFT101_004844 [Trichoderma asperellum]|uniref:Aminotransferase class III n=1 Tax=Trichoderma asperellum (strain ATCC 204424 / CBS 433.97 / NBRC 101777) TaxID=1042311 RepID=A0A2T3Z5P8_TRIA4|nr:hypothetical protein M441DRAFT_142925 [Trichoderma asperellum CBS 433.97]PTB40115.1 hypothetical protein M441DRAFT_142925 [Trichoderma asperellum CBS 433.97]UKZ89803.1 hypothetical protein TrAFT101_004844 [Trichoderma asperellum]
MASIFQPVRQNGTNPSTASKVLHPNIYTPNPKVVSAKGSYIILDNGSKILDASGGPGVVCIGHGNTEVRDAVVAQMDRLSYCHSLTFANEAAEDLAREIVDSTNGVMARATIMCSGSEAVEAGLKLARQYFVDKGEMQRVHFIARKGAFHGTTLSSLALTAKAAVQKPFEPIMLNDNVSFVSMPNLYRGMHPGETEAHYVDRLARELDEEFERIGPSRVCAFVAETASGTSMGCLTAPSGYFKAVREICDKHSVLLILDEVFCGMGRTGSMHAWEQEDVYPDIQTVAKGLAAGYAPISMLLMNQRIVDTIQAGSGFFNHGHTYSSHAVACAAALAVQRIIKRDNLLQNIQTTGDCLGRGLRAALGDHPHVGNIRGRGLMWAVEFVNDRKTKEPFPLKERVASRIKSAGLKDPWNIALNAGMGTADTIAGDHITITPPYNITVEEVELIIDRIKGVVEEVLGSKP